MKSKIDERKTLEARGVWLGVGDAAGEYNSPVVTRPLGKKITYQCFIITGIVLLFYLFIMVKSQLTKLSY